MRKGESSNSEKEKQKAREEEKEEEREQKISRKERIQSVLKRARESSKKHTVNRKNTKKQKLSQLNYDVLPPARVRGDDMEIFSDTGIFVDTKELSEMIDKYMYDRGRWVSDLMRLTMGENLKGKTGHGNGGKDKIPEEIYAAVFHTVNSYITPALRMNDGVYSRIVAQLCVREKRKSRQRGGSSNQAPGGTGSEVEEPIAKPPE
ncbi:uncharacterized protein LOC107045518, partial [Diachasma alloeum]|uniref:uncharacterized protein LOC107045518 n=1 Tax=Diachasma alloeum TaxID=454923 RepID=UPI0010FB9B4B